MNVDQINKIKAEFEYAENAAKTAGDEATAQIAHCGVTDCEAAIKLLAMGETELAQQLFSRTRQYEFDMDATSEEFIDQTGDVYYLSPEADEEGA